MKRFAIIGVGGYIAPRHLEAIRDLGHTLVAAYDRNDSVGIMDRYFPDCPFFTDFERFESHLQEMKARGEGVEYIAICTPNHMHAAHIKFSLRMGADAICEKPLVLHVSDLDELIELERVTGRRVSTVLQLRVHDAIIALKRKIDSHPGKKHEVSLTYMTSRGPWYHESWKGDERKSGGLSTNIGVHFFDMLTWIFGGLVSLNVEVRSATQESGTLELENATVKWRLTIDKSQLPPEAIRAGKTTFRSIRIDGEEFEFSEGFTELHKRVYDQVLKGQGYGLEAARTAIAIVERIREH